MHDLFAIVLGLAAMAWFWLGAGAVDSHPYHNG